MKKCKCKAEPVLIFSLGTDSIEIPDVEVDDIGINGVCLLQCPKCKTVWAEIETA